MLCPFVKTAHVVHAHFKDVVARAAVESSDDIADGACILGRLTLLLAYAARMRRIADCADLGIVPTSFLDAPHRGVSRPMRSAQSERSHPRGCGPN
jgi:hypothetical protein